LEKGYARFVGPRQQSEDWFERARGWVRVMKLDAWVSMVIYTGATIAFYLLGAAVLHGKGLAVTDADMIPTLSHMYQETFGSAGLMIFLIGAFMVLYSTAFVATASNARLFADAAALFKIVNYATPESRVRMVKAACIGLPAASVLLYLIWGKPVTLVFVGALAQGLMLPFLAAAALYFRFFQIDPPLRPGNAWTTLLAIATACMVAVGAYQVIDQVQKLREPAKNQEGPAATNEMTVP
jgi:Mn2+/Fe2+ NRAMP family transporter